MNNLSKIILFLLSSLCLFFLVFFTFITPSYNQNISQDYTYYTPWTYEISGELPDYKILKDANTNDVNALKFLNLSIWNNIYYYQGEIDVQENNNIYLWTWIYYVDINSLSNLPNIFIDWAKIITNWPGGYIINTTHKIQRSIFSLSSKIEVELLVKNNDASTYLDIYPNMIFMYNPVFNPQTINADLWRIQDVQYLNMINTPLYKTIQDDSWRDISVLNKDIQKYVFYNKENHFLFIKKILTFRDLEQKKFKKNYKRISQNSFFNFPWEQYIIDYYSYFLNDEKRKVYYKNIIIKELISWINSSKDINIDLIISNLEKLRVIDIQQYEEMQTILHFYYENIVLSQIATNKVILDVTSLIHKIDNNSFSFNYLSLLKLRNIYENFHQDNYLNYHKNLNVFIDSHTSEMDISIYDEKHRIHSYFLYFLKNILIADFTKVENHKEVISLFKKYIDIKDVYIEKWDSNTKKTALYDNAQLLKVFTNITKINFFEDQRDEQWLLVLEKFPSLSNEDYITLNEYLNKLLNFYEKYQFFINNSENRKDYILSLSYKKYSSSLSEYFEALTDYNKYQLTNNDSVTQPLFEVDNENKLDKQKAIDYLSQFIWIASFDTDIQIKNYAHCTQPDVEWIEEISDENWYCYKISNLDIEWYIFEFILTPTESNTLSHISYTDIYGEKQTVTRKYIMDRIEEDLKNKHSSAFKEDRDIYDFKRFFLNTFIYKDQIVIKEDTSKIEKLDFTPPNISESITIRKLKLALLTKNSPLLKIQNIIKIPYSHLIIENNNNVYKGSIFPVDFNLSIESWGRVNQIAGKFSADYQYTPEHKFSNVSLLIEPMNNYTSDIQFILDNNPIKLQGIFTIENTQNILTKWIFNLEEIEKIYEVLKSKYNTTLIDIVYNINTDIVNFTIWEIKVELYNKWNIKLYNEDTLYKQWRFSELWDYLNTLQ